MTKQTYLEFPYGSSAIGFNDLFGVLNRCNSNATNTNYPHYNLIQIDDDTYQIQIALVGFNKEQVTISQDRQVIAIEGQIGEDDCNCGPDCNCEDVKFLHKGISTKRFRREFSLEEYVTVKSASMVDGLLVISLKRELPEELVPKLIKIS